MALMGVAMASCKNQNTEPQTGDTVDTVQMMENDYDAHLEAIEAYLRTIGSQYAPSEVCIPSYTVVAIADSDTCETRVWGDWWVFNYNIVGDTLKCVSGGSHPGLLHLAQNDAHEWVVSSFDQVEDGSRNLESAKRIFGEWYETFHTINSNQNKRDSVRLYMVSNYVRDHDLKVSYLQDYGCPAVELWK